MKTIIICLNIFFIVMVSSGFSSEKKIRSAILGKHLSAQELQYLDVNTDQKVDVSDLIYFLSHSISLTGNTHFFSATKDGNRSFIITLSDINDPSSQLSGFENTQEIEPDISTIRSNFPCVDYYIIQENSTVFHYPGHTKCTQPDNNQSLYDITMNNLITKEGFPVNGKLNVSIENNNSMIAVTTSGNAISVSEGTYSGSFQISCNNFNLFNTNNHSISAKTNSFEFSNKNGSGTVNNIDLSILPSDTITGNIDVVYNETNYKCKLNEVRIDPVCKIAVGNYEQLPVPVGGNVEFNGFTLDFNQSTCGNPKINIEIGPFTIQLSLVDVYRVLLIEDEVINTEAKIDCVIGTLNCKLSNVKVDLECGIFTSGNAIVYHQFLPIDFATLFFDETSCNNKRIKINSFGKDFYLDWEDVIDL